MLFSAVDIVNLIALLIGMAGSFMMFYYTPEISSKVIVRLSSEMKEVHERDRYKNKMQRRGMLLLFIGFILQAAAIFLSVAIKK